LTTLDTELWSCITAGETPVRTQREFQPHDNPQAKTTHELTLRGITLWVYKAVRGVEPGRVGRRELGKASFESDQPLLEAKQAFAKRIAASSWRVTAHRIGSGITRWIKLELGVLRGCHTFTKLPNGLEIVDPPCFSPWA
jgi:hypothetical protein